MGAYVFAMTVSAIGIIMGISLHSTLMIIANSIALLITVVSFIGAKA